MIYFLDYSNNQIICKMSYKSMDLALDYIDRVALDYIRETQGTNQLLVCQKYDNPNNILSDPTLKPGYYLIKNKSHEKIYLFEKKSHLIPGYIWNSTELKLEKTGEFGITPIFIDIDLIEPIPLPIHHNYSENNTNTTKSLFYIDELKNLFNSGKLNLKNKSK